MKAACKVHGPFARHHVALLNAPSVSGEYKVFGCALCSLRLEGLNTFSEVDDIGY